MATINHTYNFSSDGGTKAIATYGHKALKDVSFSDILIGNLPAWLSGSIVKNTSDDGETGSIVLTANANDSETEGRSVDFMISYTLNEETCDYHMVTICQANKHGDTPEPPGPTVDKAIFTMNSGTIKIKCSDENSPLTKAEIEEAGVTISEVKKVEFKSCITKFTGFTFNGNENLTACTFADDIAIESIPGSFFKATKIKTIKIPSGVTTVGKEAFSGCTELTSYTFSNNSRLTTIGESCFSDCVKLKSAELPEGLTKLYRRTFNQCKELKSIIIPDSVTEIEEHVFNDCNTMTSATISSTSLLTKIGTQTFMDCWELKSIFIPNTVQIIDTAAFNTCKAMTAVTIENTASEPSVLKTIGTRAFRVCGELQKIEIPKTVESINSEAFYGCGKMSAVTFENNSVLETIGDDSFRYCTCIKSLKIPKTVKTIGSNAFGQILKTDPTQYITSLTSLTFDSGSVLETIGGGAFKYSSGLTSVAIPNTVKTIGYEAFDFTSSLTSLTFGNNSVLETIGNDCFAWASIKSITFPKTLKTIGNGAFQENQTLSSITFESGAAIETIGSWAFGSCRIKGSLVLPEGLKTIGMYAFESNQDYTTPSNSLTSVTIPSSVTSLGHGIFYACHKLKTATIKAVTPPDFVPSAQSTDEWIFYYGPNVASDLEHVYVPSGSVTAYKNARGFQNVRDIISAI